MSELERSAAQLRARLEQILAEGLSNDPTEHARQIAGIVDLGLSRVGRHWRTGELFIETVPGPVAGPAEEVEVADTAFLVVRKEVVLRDRIIGFKHWRHTAYGDQAIAMLLAFGEGLDVEWLDAELAREDALDALDALQQLARSSTPVTHEHLLRVVEDLHARKSSVPRQRASDGVVGHGRDE